MAIRKRKATTRGLIRLPPTIDIRDGQLTRQTANDLESWNRDLAGAVNGALSFGDGTQSSGAGNLDGQWTVDVKFVTKNTKVQIPHGLGRAPVGYLVLQQNKAGNVFCNGRGDFGRESVFLQSSENNLVVTLILV